jgi:tetratricopeptide (TPR) repeat protein
LQSLSRIDEAESAYREAIRVAPSFIVPWIRLGDLLQSAARYNEAQAAYRELIRIDPSLSPAWIYLGNLLADHLTDLTEARVAYHRAEELGEVRLARGNLLWLELSAGDRESAQALRALVANSPLDEGAFPPIAFRLIDSGLALLAGDIPRALFQFGDALGRDGGVPQGFFDDQLRLLRLFAKHGAGERLLAWLDETGLGEQIAPIRSAFDAYVHGERKLSDVNPETRGAAKKIYDWLTSNKSKAAVGPMWPGPGTSELDRPKRKTRLGRPPRRT